MGGVSSNNPLLAMPRLSYSKSNYSVGNSYSVSTVPDGNQHLPPKLHYNDSRNTIGVIHDHHHHFTNDTGTLSATHEIENVNDGVDDETETKITICEV